jgi:hypothetical protein
MSERLAVPAVSAAHHGFDEARPFAVVTGRNREPSVTRVLSLE